MAPRQKEPRVVTKGVEVTAVATSSGPAAMSIHVSVDPDALQETLGGAAVQTVTTRVPLTDGSGVRWEETSMKPMPPTEGSKVQQFETTHYGADESRELGIDVELVTEDGKVMTHEEGQSYGVKGADHPRTASPATPLAKKPAKSG